MLLVKDHMVNHTDVSSVYVYNVKEQDGTCYENNLVLRLKFYEN